MNWKIKLAVPNIYLDPDASGDVVFTVPMYDQDYEVNISFPKAGSSKLSFSGQTPVNYMVAYNANPIYEYDYNWTGLLEAEKDIFIEFIESFNNSFQKFNLEVQLNNVHDHNMDVIINTDNISISKNRLDLYSISLTLIKL